MKTLDRIKITGNFEIIADWPELTVDEKLMLELHRRFIEKAEQEFSKMFCQLVNDAAQAAPKNVSTTCGIS